MSDVEPIQEQLRQLYASVMSADLPETFAVSAFQELLRAQLEGPKPVGEVRSGGPSTAADGTPSTGLEALGRRLGLDVSALADVYEVIDDRIELLVPAKSLAPTASEATRQLALLIAAGWQGAGLEEATSFERIRAACVDYRKYDSKNFATHLAAMDDVFLIRGKGREREVRMARPGWARSAEIITQLVGRARD